MNNSRKMPPNLDLNWVQFDFTEAFDSDPEAALEAFHLLLLDEVNCAARVAWLRGLEDFASNHLDRFPSLPPDDFEGELQIIRDARLYPAFEDGELSPERLAKLCCSPDVLWAAHCEVMGFTDAEITPPRPAPDTTKFSDRVRLSSFFYLPKLFDASPYDEQTDDFKQEITISGYSATVYVIDRQGAWQIQIETTQHEFLGRGITVKIVDSIDSDAITFDARPSDAKSDSFSSTLPMIELRKTPGGKYFGSIEVSAREIAGRIKSRTFLIELITSNS